MTADGIIYIPAYNAAATLPEVFRRIPTNLKRDARKVLVVDNDSSDNTCRVALSVGQAEGLNNLEIIKNDRNMGYGGSQKIAYRRAIDLGVTYVAMLHGDAQYAPELLTTLITPIVDGKADMVFGSRMAGHPLRGGMPLYRYLGNRFLTEVQNLFLGTTLTEFHSGYRVYSVEALKKVPFDRLSSDYHFDTEIIILLLNECLRIRELPIPTHYGDEENYVNVWKYGIDVLVTTLTYFLHRIKWRRSPRWSYILDGNRALPPVSAIKG